MGEIKTLKAIPVKPFAVMGGAISAVIAFIYGIVFGFFAIIILVLGLASNYVGESLVSFMLIIGGIIAMIIMAFIGGLITYAIIAFIYNFLASKIGGIELELE